MKKKIIIFFILLCITGFNKAHAQDTDGDGIVNTSDLDDDNDGILDLDEGCGNIVSSEERGTFGTTTVNHNLSANPGPGYNYQSGQLLNAGDYAVISNAAPQPHPNPEGWNYNGHTTNTVTDAYLAVNGSTQVGVFFRQSVRLVAGATYTYSFWHAGAVNTSLANGYNIRIRVMNSSNTTELANALTGQMNSNIWSQTSLSFTPTVTGDYNILLQNESTGFTGNDFSIDDISFTSPCGTLDTDGDGTPDYLDLDSDNDGCFDALEGDENVGNIHLNSDGSINISATGGINSDGVPNLVNAGGTSDTGSDTGQGTGSSINAAINTACTDDMDNDGFTSLVDLDDDNDGIPDTVENTCILPSTTGTSAQPHLRWDLNTTPLPGGLETNQLTPDVITANSTVSFGSGILAVNNASRWQISNVNSTTATQAKTNNDYIQFTVPMAATSNRVLELKEWTTNGGQNPPPQNLSIEIADNAAFTGSTVLYTGPNTNTAGFQKYPFTTNYRLQKGTVYYVRAYIYGSSTTVVMDGFGLGAQCFTDTDGDGIPDPEDLDSDNDGCFDALEGDENIGKLQLNPDSSINVSANGGTNNTGVPNLVNTGGAADIGSDTGQGIGASANAAISTACASDTDNDGIANTTDLDDDNDGILDTVENTCILPSTTGTSAQPHLGWDDNFTPLPGGLEINQLSPDVITANSTVSFGSGISVVNQNSNWQISNVNSTTAAQAKANNDYIQFTIPMAATSNRVLELKEWTTFGGQPNQPMQNLSIEIANNAAFTGATVLFTGANTNGPGFQKYPFGGNYRLQKGTVYYVRVYLYGSAPTVTIDSFGLGAQCFTDTDGDGIPDPEDLDSDGDGCFDAIEGDENVTPTQLNADGSINISANGGINATG
ncbi:hypothetical protein PMI13_01344, partial [Chryseobacterium populi]